MPRGDVVDGVDDLVVSHSCADRDDDARPVACADERVRGVRRAVDEVPGFQAPLLALDDEHALAGDHEEVLLTGLAVVHAARLAGPDHGDAHAELLEVAVPLEVRPAPEPLAFPPARVSRVEHEPARPFRAESFRQLFKLRLGHHQPKSGRSPFWYGLGSRRVKRAYASPGSGVVLSTLAPYFAATSFTG